MNCCYIFGSLDVPFFPIETDETDIIIAADKGLLNTKKFNLTPDYIVGDFDSLGYVPDSRKVIKHPVMKNETDLILAVDTGLDLGYKSFFIYGAIGGRLDQTVATIQTAEYILKNGGTPIIFGNDNALTILKNSKIKFYDDCRGIVSVFSYSESCEGVNEKGLLYSLENARLSNAFPLGVSNEFKGENAEISVKSGSLLVIWNNNGKFIIGE